MFNRKKIKRLKAIAEQAQQYLEGTKINDQWHVCNGCKVRQYPAMLCSCCPPYSGLDFNPMDIVLPELMKSGLISPPDEEQQSRDISYDGNYVEDYEEYGKGSLNNCPKCGHEFFGYKRLVCKVCRDG